MQTYGIRAPFVLLSSILFAALLLVGCGGGDSQPASSASGTSAQLSAVRATSKGSYLVVAWNDLGMHCLNPDYDTAVILPPYNTLWAQVIQRSNPPKVVTSGVTVEYRVVNNTHSYGKRSYGGFWDYVVQLFGTSLQRDTGLNLDDPQVHNGLSGTMLAKGDHFQASGIPVTPVSDNNGWNPYQVAEITVKDRKGNVVAKTRTTIPTSDEINCGKCHGSSPFQDILARHDAMHGTTLVNRKPVLCASCHGSPVLGQQGPGSSGLYLSRAIHGSHASRGATCYDCHPGSSTKCSRSLAHTAPDGNCQACHGTMADVASSVASGARTPWLGEPECAACHAGVPGVSTGTALYRASTGHGGIYCEGCHGSPHAMVPSREESDNYQATQYQGAAKTLGSCGACHRGSRGGSGNFLVEHGSGGRPSACDVCHTGFTNPSQDRWPHAFQWKDRAGVGTVSGD